MIYLFNSAYKQTYFENVYRLIGLPHNVYVELRYSELNAPSSESDESVKNKDCIVCYVDRFASHGYVYYPFRKGVVRSIKRMHSRVYYNIELRDYCHTESPEEFTKMLRASVDNAPSLTDSDPQCGNDGMYCIDGPDLKGLLSQSSNSWSEALDLIYQTSSFQDAVPSFYQVVITRAEKCPPGKKYGLLLHANTEYELAVYYKYPDTRLGNGRKDIKIKMGEQIEREMHIGSASDRLVIPFTLPPLDFSAGAISIESTIVTDSSAGGETSYTASIPFRTRAWRSNLLLFGILFLVAFFDEFRQVEWQLSNSDAWVSTLLEFLKFAVVIWAVFKYRGKLKLPGL